MSKKGTDSNQGTIQSPFLTIQAAANVAKADDIIEVHEGIYREWVNPKFGGESNNK